MLAVLEETAAAEADAIDRMQARLTTALPTAPGREVSACA
jgi:ArsR family transcriptional regulator